MPWVGKSMDRRRNQGIAAAMVVLCDAASVLAERWPGTAKDLRALANKGPHPHQSDAALAALALEQRAALCEHSLTKERMASPTPTMFYVMKDVMP